MRRTALAALAALGWLVSSCAPRATGPGATATRTPTTAPTPGQTPSASPLPSTSPKAAKEARLIARTLGVMTKLRGIEATREVPGVVLARDRLIARVKEHVAREVPPEEIEREGLVLHLLGFVPDSFDYGKEMFALLESQLAGFYEPEDATMYMASDLDGLNAEATLAHELVHALQDQHWDLKKRSKFKQGQSDKSSALAALAEGDATSAMADYIVGKMDPTKSALDVPEDVFTEQVLGSVSSGMAATTPHVMRTSLVAPYVDGLVFVNGLRRRGGWTAVNRAWDDLPTTTEQILHMDKFDAREPALEVGAPPAATLGAGWASVDEDTYGEEGLRLIFEEWLPTAEAKSAASAWGGDRGTLYTAAGKAALAVHLRYDEARGANRDVFAERGFKMVGEGIAKLGKVQREAGFVCIERKALGPLALRRVGRDVVLVAGPAKTDPKTGAPPGDCAVAKAWTAEIAR